MYWYVHEAFIVARCLFNAAKFCSLAMTNKRNNEIDTLTEATNTQTDRKNTEHIRDKHKKESDWQQHQKQFPLLYRKRERCETACCFSLL